TRRAVQSSGPSCAGRSASRATPATSASSRERACRKTTPSPPTPLPRGERGGREEAACPLFSATLSFTSRFLAHPGSARVNHGPGLKRGGPERPDTDPSPRLIARRRGRFSPDADHGLQYPGLPPGETATLPHRSEGVGGVRRPLRQEDPRLV